MSLSDIRNNGLNPLSYLGVQSYSPANFIKKTFDPTSNDSQNFTLGTIWLNMGITPQKVWILTSLSAGVATWIEFATGAGVVFSLTGNTGGAVFPTAGNTNVIGDGTTITIAGNPGASTLTVSAVGSGVISTLTGNSGGAVSPSAGNINTVGDGTTINIVGNPGTHTLTASTTGIIPDSFPTDSGTAVPAAGVLNVFGGTSGRDINTSGSGHTIHVDLNNTITVGDLVNVPAGSNSITMTSGDLILNGDSGVANAHGIAKIKFLDAAGTGHNDIYFYLNNIFIGEAAGNQTMTPGTAIFNDGIGSSALSSLTTGHQNNAYGNACLQNLTTGSNNVAMGYVSLQALTTASNNVALGSTALSLITTGANNIGIGLQAGQNYTSSESNNIIIGNAVAGTLGESNIMRIGAGTGGGAGQLNKSFISGIRGVTTDAADAIAVLISSTGQLGTVSSSERYKDNIEDMEHMSSLIMDLRPVTFTYKSDKTNSTQYGLIAEEVAEVFDDIVVYDKEGLPESIQYHVLPVLLLNELQKLSKDLEELREECEDFKSSRRSSKRKSKRDNSPSILRRNEDE